MFKVSFKCTPGHILFRSSINVQLIVWQHFWQMVVMSGGTVCLMGNGTLQTSDQCLGWGLGCENHPAGVPPDVLCSSAWRPRSLGCLLRSQQGVERRGSPTSICWAFAMWFFGVQNNSWKLSKTRRSNQSKDWLSWWLSWQRICLQCGRPEFNPWVGKIPWKRKQLPSPVFWPENSVDCTVHGVTKTQTQLSDFHFHFSLS